MFCPNPAGDCRRTYKGSTTSQRNNTDQFTGHTFFMELAKVLVSKVILIYYFYIRLGNPG